MRNPLLYIPFTILFSTLLFSCKNTPKEAAQPVTLGTLSFSKTEGPGCDNPDGEHTGCARVDLQWPTVEQGPDALKKSVAAWATAYLIGISAPDTKGIASVEAGVAAFFKTQKEFAKEAPDSPMANFSAESNWDVLLNDGQYLSLEIEGFIYMGGAHGSPTAVVATFDVSTGKQLTWAELVTDTAALKTLAEKTFRAERQDIFSPSDGSEPFDFDSTFPFALPQNYCLAPDGIYCHYVAYEVGPYAIGSTQFTIPFEALGALAKIKPAPGEVEELPDFYRRDGGQIVLPTFEIEVANSPKAGQKLTKQQETTIVSAYFSSDPLDERDRDEIGEIPVAKQEIELTGGERIARFEGIKFSKRLYDKLADKDVRLLVNVYSGRRSSEYNLLDCGFLQTKASQFRNKRYVLGCKIIGENTQVGAGANDPIACYTLPETGATPDQKPALLVACTENGQIEWASKPMKDYAALKAALRPVLADLIKKGAKELPDLKTEGCMMGSSSEIRSMYEELKGELMGKNKGGAPK